MAKQFSFEPGGPVRLRIVSKGRGAEIFVDDARLAFLSGRALAAGEHFTLADGSELEIAFRNGLWNGGWHVSRNGQPLPGTASDATQRMREAATVLFFCAGATALFSALGAAGLGFALRLGLNAWTFLDAGLFLVLGLFTHRGSRVALWLGIALFVIESLWALPRAPSGMIMRVFFAIVLVRAVPAANQLKREEQEPAS